MTHEETKPFAFANLSPETWSSIMSSQSIEALEDLVRLPDNSPSCDRETVLAHAPQTKVLITGWGSTPLSTADLEAFSQLELIVHAAGTLRSAFPDLNFRDNIRVCSAVHVNARPVAEYTLGLILCALRGTFTWTDRLRQSGISQWWQLHSQSLGYSDRTIALVGFGVIAKFLIALLRPFEFRILVVSDFATEEDAERLGFEKASLADAAKQADILSIHEANLPQFRHMIDAALLDSLKDGCTLINTARGALVDELALANALQQRPIVALLDVIENENLSTADHPLLHLPNCFISPHIAGSVAGEIKRFGDYVAREIGNWKSSRPLEGSIPLASLAFRA